MSTTTAIAKRKFAPVVLGRDAVAKYAATTSRKNKAINNEDFSQNDGKGINFLHGFVVHVGKNSNSQKALNNIILMMGKSKKEDLGELPDYVARWNDNLNCPEINIRRHHAQHERGVQGEAHYPADRADWEWVPLPAGTILTVPDFKGLLSIPGLEGSVVRVLNIRVTRTNPNKKEEDNAYWKEYSWTVSGKLDPLASAPGNPLLLRKVFDMLPFQAFKLPSPLALARLCNGDSIHLMVHILPCPDVDSETLSEVLATKATFSCMTLRRVTDPSGWTFAERVAGAPVGAPAQSGGATAALTSATVPVTNKKTALLTGTVMQKEDPLSAKIRYYEVRLRIWDNQVEFMTQISNPDNYLVIAQYAHLFEMHVLGKVDIERSKNAIANASRTTADAEEDDGEELFDTPVVEKQHQHSSKNNSKETAASQVDEDDMDAVAFNTQNNGSGEAVSREKFSGTVELNGTHVYFDMAAFLRKYAFKVTVAWAKKIQVGANDKKTFRNYFTRNTDFKPVHDPTQPVTLPPVVCVSDYAARRFKDWIKLVEERKGEFYILPECNAVIPDTDLASVSKLTHAQSEAILDNSEKAPFHITRATDSRLVLFFVNSANKDEEAHQAKLQKLITTMQDKILPDENDDATVAATSATAEGQATPPVKNDNNNTGASPFDAKDDDQDFSGPAKEESVVDDDEAAEPGRHKKPKLLASTKAKTEASV
jgi:hypothetical protein